MKHKVPQLENDSDLLKAVNDFLDNLESIGIEADVKLEKDGNLTVLYQKPASIPSIKNNRPLKIQTPEDNLDDLDMLLRGTENQMNDLFTGSTMQNNYEALSDENPKGI